MLSRNLVILALATALAVPGIAIGWSAGSSQSIGNGLQIGSPALAQVSDSQPARVEDAWQRVYQMVPGLPLENQYVSKETGKVADSNTLIGRLIRYHIYVKGRAPIYRLDWKLTLADYLGVNDRMTASIYPSADTLKTNPMSGDVAAVARLTRAQRNALVDALASIFNPDASAAGATGTPQPNASPTAPASSPRPAAAPAPQSRPPEPGDARLLMP